MRAHIWPFSDETHKQERIGGCRSRLVERLLRFYNSNAGLIPLAEGET